MIYFLILLSVKLIFIFGFSTTLVTASSHTTHENSTIYILFSFSLDEVIYLFVK